MSSPSCGSSVPGGRLTFAPPMAGGGALPWPALAAWSKFLLPLCSLGMRGGRDLSVKTRKLQRRAVMFSKT